MTFNPLGTLKVPANVTLVTPEEPKALPGNTYKRWGENVFKHMPTVSDVKQGNIGNCYLLASLQAILARPDGPSVIQELVKDEGEYAIIKMHKDGIWHYVKIEKTLPGKMFSDRDHSIGAKWVQLFEKAFAAFIKGSYEAMGRGGDNLAAIPVFLGSGASINKGPAESLRTLQMLTNHPKHYNDESAKNKEKLYKSFHGDIGLSESEICEWFTWRDGCQLNQKSFADCYAPPYTKRFDQIIERFSNGPCILNPPVKTKILQWYARETPIPGVVGSGIYTLGQLDFFMRIQRAIAAQRSVGVETMNRDVWPVVATSRHRGNGESKLDGLASDHAYSIADTKIEGNLRYFLIRNPWGTYQRLYVAGPGGTLTPRAGTSSGDSWIELADFFLYFQPAFSEGAPVHTAARAALMTDMESQLQRARERLKPLTRPRAHAVVRREDI